MKKVLSLVMAVALLLGIASQASASGGVNFFNPYPNSTNATVPNYIGFTKAAGTYQYQLFIQETNAGNRTYNSGKLYAPSSGYEIRHTLSSMTKNMLPGGTYLIRAECFNISGTLIGSDSTTVMFL